MSENGWDEVKKLINYRIDEQGTRLEKIEEALQAIREDISTKAATKHELEELEKEFNAFKLQYTETVTKLNAKAGMWGGLAGLIPVVITLAILAISSVI